MVRKTGELTHSCGHVKNELLLNKIPNDEVSDTTDDATVPQLGTKKIL